MTAIPNENMAFVEYIKNSYDSYIRLNYDIDEKNMYIKIGVNVHERYIYVIDHASGMNSDELMNNFSQVGSHTGGSNNNINALFSKGATDTTALGDVTYVSIKNGKLSSCEITHYDVYNKLINDKDVDDEERIKYGIPINGTYLKLSLLDQYNIKSYSFNKQVVEYFSLKNIIENPNVSVLFDYIDINNNYIDKDLKLCLNPIEIETVLIKDEKIEIPGWTTDSGEKVYSYFNLYLAKEDIDSLSTDSSYKRSGCYINYNDIIIDKTLFHRSLETVPIAKRIFGTLRCDFIYELLLRYDKGDLDSRNNLPLIEPNRLTGLNRHHDFVSDLTRVPREHTKYIIEDLDEKQSSFNENSTVKINDLFNIIGDWHSAILYEMKEFLYSYTRTKNKSSYNKLIKLSENVKSLSTDSEYNFKNVENIIKADNGDIDPSFPSLFLTFIYDDVNLYPYVLYNVNSRIQIDLNVTDFLLSSCVKYDPSNKTFKITNIEYLTVNLIHYISEALSREIFKFMDDKLNSGEVIERNSDDSFNKLFKLRPSLHMALYNVLVTKNKINDLISNET
jgi:hypothetical protein